MDTLLCIEVINELHRMFHETTDKSSVCLQSGNIHFKETEPECSLVVMMALVDTKHARDVQLVGHQALSEKITELYGVSREAKKKGLT